MALHYTTYTAKWKACAQKKFEEKAFTQRRPLAVPIGTTCIVPFRQSWISEDLDIEAEICVYYLDRIECSLECNRE